MTVIRDEGEVNDHLRKLLALLRSRRATLVAGAGTSMCVGGPSGEDLVKALLKKFECDCEERDIRGVSQDLLDLRKASREQVEDFIQGMLGRLEPNDMIKKLCSYPWAACFTTNFDSVLPAAFRHNEREAIVVREDRPSVNILDPTKLHVFQVMGSIEERTERRGRMVLTQQDYEQALSRRRMYFDLLAEATREGTAVFIGYSFNDRIILDILRDIESRHGPDSLPPLFAIFRAPIDDTSRNIQKLSARNVTVIECNIESFVEFVDKHWGEISEEPRPPGHASVVINDKTLYLPMSLITSLGPYVDFLDETTLMRGSDCTISQFLRNETESWIPFEKNWDFRRDAKNSDGKDLELRVQLELRRTNSKDNKVLFLLGDAGSGKTTMARRIAYNIAHTTRQPVFFVRDLGMRSKNMQFDEIFERMLTDYSDTVQEPGKGEEVKFTIMVDNAGGGAPDAIRLFDYLTGNGRPLLMILVDRGEDLKDIFNKPKAYRELVRQNDQYFLRDEMDMNEVERLAGYLRETGLWNLDTGDLIQTISQQYCRSFWTSVYSFVEPSRPPLAEIERSLFLSLNEVGKRFYLSIATLHQFGAEPPFELIRRSVPMPLIELNDLLTKKPTSELFLMRETESGIDTIRTHHRILASKMVSIFKPSLSEQLDVLAAIVSSANFASEFERDFAISFLVKSFGHRTRSEFSLQQRIGLFQEAADANEDQVLLHHLALLLQLNGQRDEAKHTLEKAIERGRRQDVREEAPELLLTSLAGLKADEAITELENGNLGKAEFLIEEANGLFEQIQQSSREVGHAFHRHAYFFFKLSELTTKPQEKEEFLHSSLTKIEMGLDSTQDEDTRIALLELQTRVFAQLDLPVEEGQSIEVIIAEGKKSDSVLPLSMCMRRLASSGVSKEKRLQLLTLARDKVATAIKKDAGNPALLRETVLLAKELTPTDFERILNYCRGYLAQESNPPPAMIFEAGVAAYHLGYFDQSDDYFAQLSKRSHGFRSRSRLRCAYVDEHGSPVRFDGVVDRIVHAKYGRIRITGPRATGRLVEFAPIGFLGRVDVGDRLAFEIWFSFRGPVARLLGKTRT